MAWVQGLSDEADRRKGTDMEQGRVGQGCGEPRV